MAVITCGIASGEDHLGLDPVRPLVTANYCTSTKHQYCRLVAKVLLRKHKHHRKRVNGTNISYRGIAMTYLHYYIR